MIAQVQEMLYIEKGGDEQVADLDKRQKLAEKEAREKILSLEKDNHL